jgi:uncharacterized membrane protein YhaH (DUF805 family)
MGTQNARRWSISDVLEIVFDVLSIVLLVIFIIAGLLQVLGIHDMGLNGWVVFAILFAACNGASAIVHSSDEKRHQSNQSRQQNHPTQPPTH